MRVTFQARTREKRSVGVCAPSWGRGDARKLSLPIDRLPARPGPRGGGFISTQLQGGRRAALAS